jgi:Domain of unknown function (DUF4338)
MKPRSPVNQLKMTTYARACEIFGLERLSRDWQSRYGHPLWLVETFVQTDRFVGTAYQAAGWSSLGQTTGRTRQDRRHSLQTPPKTVWVRPLHPRFREVLCAL